MGITRISDLRDCGVFRDFRWPVGLTNFGRYNLIYGWNGSGKTTLSRIFRCLETGTAPAAGQVNMTINGRDVGGGAFPQVALAVRVFNRDFIAESVFPVGGGDVAPIFVLGKESVEAQKQVEELKTVIAEAQTSFGSAQAQKRNCEKALDKHLIDRATVIRDTLRSSGSNPYNNYNKADFQKRAEKMVTDGDAGAHRLSDSDREKWLAQHRATPKSALQSVVYHLPALKPLAEEVSELLAFTVASTTIQSLKDDTDLANWVHQGLRLHEDRRPERCLFCEQSLSQDRLAALRSHFSVAYEHFLERLEAQIIRLQAASDATAGLMLPNRAQLYDDLVVEYDVAERSVRLALDSTNAFLDSLVQALIDKKDRIFESLHLNVAVSDVDFDAVDCLNGVILRHNQASGNFRTRVSEARERLEADSVAAHLEEFTELRNAVQSSLALVNRADAEVKRLDGEIARLERGVVEHRQPAEELNEDLRRYLGHNELRLQVKHTGYAITRDGHPAQSLSEGEVTAIALLYFLKSLRDRRFDLANGVVVLDDPVSSLDANALYLAFSFIRERTRGVAQLFILTHNFTLFRQVRNWFHHIKRDVRFYMLECAQDRGQRCTSLRWLDPLLERYESEYHYLFARVYREATASANADLEKNYVLPNMARRLLETFLAFRQPQATGGLWSKLQAVPFDEAKKIRIDRFLNTYSHNGAIEEPEHDLSSLAETRSVLRDLLGLIEAQDRDHFSAMEDLVRPHFSEAVE